VGGLMLKLRGGEFSPCSIAEIYALPLLDFFEQLLDLSV
jgi:hypothetical protein